MKSLFVEITILRQEIYYRMLWDDSQAKIGRIEIPATLIKWTENIL